MKFTKEIKELLKSYVTEMENYGYFGSNPGIKEEDIEEISEKIEDIVKKMISAKDHVFYTTSEVYDKRESDPNLFDLVWKKNKTKVCKNCGKSDDELDISCPM